MNTLRNSLDVTPMTIRLLELSLAPESVIHSYSPYCTKVHAALVIAGLAHESVQGTIPTDHKKHNPRGQVPVVEFDGDYVYDSTDIIERIVDLAPGKLLTGDEDLDAEAWLWEEFSDSALNPFVIASRWADETNWPQARAAFFATAPAPIRGLIAGMVRKGILKSLKADAYYPAEYDRYWKRFDKLLDRLERRAPERGFWLGEQVTVADVGIYSQLQSIRAGLSPKQGAMIEERRTLTAWLERVHALI